MKTVTRYYCQFCETRKAVEDIPPLEADRTIRTGCHGRCEGQTPHHPVGQPEVRA
jgi:hypothetical protein